MQIEYTFNTKLDLSETDDYIIKVTVILQNDEVSGNNSQSIIIHHIICEPYNFNSLNDFQFFEGFEEELFPPQCWISYDHSSIAYWDRNDNPDNTFEGVGSAIHRYNSSTQVTGWLITPQMTIPPSGNYVLEFFSKNAYTRNKYNGIWISVAGNDTTHFIEMKQLEGAEISTNWKKIIIPLDDFKGQDINIGFKYRNYTDGDYWYIDNVKVYDFTDIIDVELTAIVTPVSGTYFSSNEPVKVLINNHGSESIEPGELELKLELDGTVVHTETYYETIPSLTSAEFTFPHTLNLSVEDIYNIKVYANYKDLINVEISKQIIHYGTVLVPEVIINPKTFTYDGFAKVPEITVKIGALDLVYRNDYDWNITSWDLGENSAGTNAGTVKILIEGRGDFTGVDLIEEFYIEKADPYYTIPEGLTAVFGARLGDIKLSNTNWQWHEPNTIFQVGEQLFRANYVPSDSRNYNTIFDVDIPITVLRAKLAFATNKPIEVYHTDKTIVIYPVAKPNTGQDIEYAISETNSPPETGWIVTDDNPIIFTSLKANTTYFIFARAQENSNYFASDASEALEITTNDAPIPPHISTISLPNAETNIYYEMTLEAIGDLPLKWTIAQGDLPSGFTLSTDGIISGFTTQVGLFTFTVKLENEDSSDTRQFTINIPKLGGAKVDAPTLDNKTHQTISINAVPPPQTGQDVENTIINANYPLDPNKSNWQTGLFFAGLTEKTTYNIYARAKGNENYSTGQISQPLAVTTDEKPIESFEITTETLPDGKLNTPYSETLKAGIMIVALEWSVVNGDLPTGLTLNSQTGAITGTPTKAGIYNFEIQAETKLQGSAFKSFKIIIEKGAGATVSSPTFASQNSTSITLNAVTQPVNGQNVEYAISETNNPPIAGWRQELAFTNLQVNKMYYFFARAQENDNYYQGDVSQEAICSTTPVLIPPSIITYLLPEVKTNLYYEFTLEADGDFPMEWSIAQGALPSGFSLSANGKIAGETNLLGLFTFTIKVENDAGAETRQFTIDIPKHSGATVSSPTLDSKTHQNISINAVAPPQTGQDVEYTIINANSSLDPNESDWQTTLFFAGLTEKTTYNIYARAKGNENYSTGQISQPLAVTTDDAPIESFQITTETLPDGKLNTPYSETLKAGIMNVSLEWSVVNGDLPTGLTLNSQTGTITGTPTKAGVYNFEIQAETKQQGSAFKSFKLIIEKGAGATVSSPTLATQTTTSITLNAVKRPDNDQNVEYAHSETNRAPEDGWQLELIFTNLSVNRTYYFFARAQENDNYYQGAASQGNAYSTDPYIESANEFFLNENNLKAWTKNETLHISGLSAGKQLNVYNATGMLIYQCIADSDEVIISISLNGLYIIQSEDKTVKLIVN